MSSKFAWSLEKIRNLEQYTLKIIKILRTASLASNITGSYIKKSVPTFLVLILQSTCFICTTWKCKQTMEQQSHRACEWTKSKQKQKENQVTSHSNWPRVVLFDLAHKKCNGIIKAWLNVWLSMMSGHGAISLIKQKFKRPEHLLTPPPAPPRRITSHFRLSPSPQPILKWTSYVYHPLDDTINSCKNSEHFYQCFRRKTSGKRPHG